MSYVRFGQDSDVYVFHSVYGGYECCGCHLNPDRGFNSKTISGAIAHLQVHIAAGHKVPQRALIRLRYENGETQLKSMLHTINEQQYYEMEFEDREMNK
jgi:hypothetical protein